MSLFKNLARVIAAPIEIVDKAIVEPLGDVAEAVTEGIVGKDDER